MITISGNEVNPGGTNAPSLYDIGYALSQTSRFGGHTQRPYSVLAHLYATRKLAEYRSLDEDIQLHALLHDAHEAVISDIPNPWKTDDMRALQKELDRRIYKSLGVELPTPEQETILKQLDTDILRAEMLCVGPLAYTELQIKSDEVNSVLHGKWLSKGNPSQCGQDYRQLAQTLIARIEYSPA